MKQIIAALCAGLVFGLGLVVSRMVDPAKVLGFLDIAGNWDPSLAFVMGGAVLLTVPGFPRILKRSAPVLGSDFHIPSARDIPVKMVIGSALFGVGWGLVGMCPGPALTSITLGYWQSPVFVGAMITGSAAYLYIFRS